VPLSGIAHTGRRDLRTLADGAMRAHPLRPRLGSKTMNVRPLHDRLIVRRLEEGEQKSGGIIIPDTAKEKPQRGTVIAAGSGKVNDEGTRVPLDVKTGDVILFGKYANEVTLDGEDYVILREDEVLAVIEGGDANATK